MDFQCVDGVPVACNQLDPADSHCLTCGGCSAEQFCCGGESCTTDGACEPRKGLGEPCSGFSACTSDRCLPVEEGGNDVCVVQPGEECTPETCGSCDPASDGGTVCTRSCSTEEDCDGGERCIQMEGEPLGFCRATCGIVGGGACPEGFTCTDVSSIPENLCIPDRLL